MNFVKTFFSCEGRLNRLPYFGYSILLGVVVRLLSTIISSIMGLSSPTPDQLADPLFLSEFMTKIYYVYGIASLVVVYPSVCLLIKRIKDLDKNPWMALLTLVPFVNAIFGLYLLFAKGTEGSNKYGADPLKKA